MLTVDLSATARRMAAALSLQAQAILRWRPDRFTLLLTILALLGAALILARQVTYGVGLDLDSVHYIFVARRLLEGEGFVQLMNKVPYVLWSPLYPMLLAATTMVVNGADSTAWWPPLYPLLLAGASFFLFDPYAVVGPFHAAIFGLIIFVAGHYLRQHLHSRFLVLWTCLAILLSIPLTMIASSARSDLPFLLFVIVSLLQTDNFLGQGKRASLLWAAMFASLACLTRYIGLALPMTIVLLLLFQRNTGAVAKVKHIIAYILISVFPITLWMLRNFLLSGTLTGPRSPSDLTLPQSLDIMLLTLSSWVFRDLLLTEFHRFAVILTGLALLALAIALGGILRAQQKIGTWTAWRPFYLFGSFTLVYFISFTATFATVDLLGDKDRYLSPVYIPLLFTAVFVMDRFWRAEQQRKLLGTIGDLPFIGTTVRGRMKQVSLLTVLLSTALSLWLSWSVPIQAHAIRQANLSPNISSTLSIFADSEVLQYIREHSIDDAMVTNIAGSDVVWYIDVSAFYFIPHMSYWPAPIVASADNGRRADYHHIPIDNWYRYQVRQFIGDTNDDVYLVWFYRGFQTPNLDFQMPNPDMLPELEPIADLADGVILKVNKAYGNDDAYRAITATQPTVRSNFNLHLNDNSLHYVRDTCRPADIQARFFLHITPHNTNDLPQHRQQYGFDNLNFDFYEHGVRFDGKCLASVPLPDYPIARINTGQFISGEGQLWEGEFPFHDE